MGIGRGTDVLDLGCGTGIFTRLALSSGASVVGAEPLEAMAAAYRARTPGAPPVAAIAEALPFRDAAFEVVACASAFHWFDHARALVEIHRVLRPGGRLGLVWNRRDRLRGWAEEFWAITEQHRGDTPGYRRAEWRDAVETAEGFGPVRETRIAHVQRTDLDGLLARVASISFIETLPADRRAAVLEQARDFLLSHPDTKDSDTFELPYSTAVYVVERD